MNCRYLFQNDRERLTKQQIEEMVSKAERFAAEDEMMRKRIETRNQLENLICGINQSVNETLRGKISLAEKLQIKKTLDKISTVRNFFLPTLLVPSKFKLSSGFNRIKMRVAKNSRPDSRS